MPKLTFHFPIRDPDRRTDVGSTSSWLRPLLALAALPLALLLFVGLVLLIALSLYLAVLVELLRSLLDLWHPTADPFHAALPKPHFLDNPKAPQAPTTGDEAIDA